MVLIQYLSHVFNIIVLTKYILNVKLKNKNYSNFKYYLCDL